MDAVKVAKKPSKSDEGAIMKSMERMGECMMNLVPK